MRRIVSDYIATAIDRARPQLEQFIAGHLQCPEAVPLVFSDPVASIREIRSLKITPRFPGDYPTVDVVAALRVSLTARTRRRGVDIGTRTFAADVTVEAVGAGYDLVPKRARLTAWWANGYGSTGSVTPFHRKGTLTVGTVEVRGDNHDASFAHWFVDVGLVGVQRC